MPLGRKQVNVFTGELADVVMEERRTLCDEDEVVAGVPMHFHGGKAFISHRAQGERLTGIFPELHRK